MHDSVMGKKQGGRETRAHHTQEERPLGKRNDSVFVGNLAAVFPLQIIRQVVLRVDKSRQLWDTIGPKQHVGTLVGDAVAAKIDFTKLGQMGLVGDREQNFRGQFLVPQIQTQSLQVGEGLGAYEVQYRCFFQGTTCFGAQIESQ